MPEARPRILFVDDEHNIRLTLGMYLEDQGFSVTSVATVPEALKLITEEQFDVLIADLNVGLLYLASVTTLTERPAAGSGAVPNGGAGSSTPLYVSLAALVLGLVSLGRFDLGRRGTRPASADPAAESA